jgi:hypothetical protein
MASRNRHFGRRGHARFAGPLTSRATFSMPWSHTRLIISSSVALVLVATCGLWTTLTLPGRPAPEGHVKAALSDRLETPVGSMMTAPVAKYSASSTNDGSPVAAPSPSLPTTAHAAASGDPGSGPIGTVASQPSSASSPRSTVAVPSGLPDCEISSFVASATTDKRHYFENEPVTISVTVTNTGPACATDERAPYGGLVCIGADVEDLSGGTVWTVWAPPITGCAASGTNAEPPTILPAGWSQEGGFTWQQDICTNHVTNCTGQSVPTGQYQVFGDNWMHLSAPVWIAVGHHPWCQTELHRLAPPQAELSDLPSIASVTGPGIDEIAPLGSLSNSGLGCSKAGWQFR